MGVRDGEASSQNETAILKLSVVWVTLWTRLIVGELFAKIQETAAETLLLSFHPSYLRGLVGLWEMNWQLRRGRKAFP